MKGMFVKANFPEESVVVVRSKPLTRLWISTVALATTAPGGVHYAAINRTRIADRLRGSVKTQHRAEKYGESRVKRLLIRSQHEFLQKNLVQEIEDTALGTRAGLYPTES